MAWVSKSLSMEDRVSSFFLSRMSSELMSPLLMMELIGKQNFERYKSEVVL